MKEQRHSFKNSSKALVINALTSRFLNSLAYHLAPPLLPVFTLHRFHNDNDHISGHKPEFLDQVLHTLRKKGYAFLGLDEAIDQFDQNKCLRHKMVAFTMDDGFDDQVRTGAEIFGAHNCPVTCFLITDFIDGLDWPWDSKVGYLLDNITERQIKIELDSASYDFDVSDFAQRRAAAHCIRNIMKQSASRNVASQLDDLIQQTGVRLPEIPPHGLKPVSWETARALEFKGIKFGAHGMSHDILSAQSDTEANYEISGAWQRLSHELKDPSRVFCYPVGQEGDYSGREEKIVETAGYLAAVSAQAGYVTNRTLRQQRYSLPRFAFPDSLADTLQYCSWIEYAKDKFIR
ncbi:hypothetical protein ACP86_00070 [Marinobacter sp. CP1]|jgi:peptidoglycan/xylan/chitin deacetylase (PgdA/CDA1 family)|uniref:polysaccharide deacetylase family protein n=1 Tax=unclassified Marinobacter TaxID=83889 RepID=UPI00069FD1EB|nr:MULTISPECIES: polysaccharide deacetylase family protein [unclassified Marinobacter]AKV94698.1 hypothetical protein ACP86_00070 [Marinobacter sp. CP1]